MSSCTYSCITHAIFYRIFKKGLIRLLYKVNKILLVNMMLSLLIILKFLLVCLICAQWWTIL